MTDMTICGLTEWENKEIKEHKGECRHCMYNETWHDKGEIIRMCKKKGHLKEFKDDCNDWVLDMR